MIDESGASLERFTTRGVGPEVHAAIGREPRGRGILGVLIHEAEPLRLHDLRADPRSVGFPFRHPEMRTFLGVPVKLRHVAYGNPYLTEKQGRVDFTEEDEAVLTLLSAQAAVAIENARLYESVTRWSRQLESINELMTAIAGEVELPRILALVATRLSELLDARVVSVVLNEPSGGLSIAASSNPDLIGAILPSSSKCGTVMERGVSERVDRLAEDPDTEPDRSAGLGAAAGIFAPLVVGGRSLGSSSLRIDPATFRPSKTTT